MFSSWIPFTGLAVSGLPRDLQKLKQSKNILRRFFETSIGEISSCQVETTTEIFSFDLYFKP